MVLLDKRLITADGLRRYIEAHDMDQASCELGQRVVARAWVDASYRARLLTDGGAALRELLARNLDASARL
eukprot:COSAG01_NODE_34601_length_545_cov_0.551570_1_plen_70_part_10